MEPRTTAGSSNLACAIDAHSRRGELDQARAGMARNPGAQALAGLALDRRHQALWPDSDRLGADGFRKAMEQDAERAAAAAKAAPGNAKLLTDQMRALRKLGRYGEALALGKPIAANKAQIETIGDDAFWLVNEYANNLSYSGHIDDAIATFDGLLSLGIASYPQLVSMAINRAMLLNDAGRHDRALAAVLELENNHPDQISLYGRMWVWAEHACALHALGRGDEAKAVEAKMAAKPDDNWAAMSRAAACRKDVPALATILITRLRDESERGGALGLFVRFRNTETILPYEAQLRATVQAATQTPAVQAEFQKVGRVITYAGNHAGWQDY